MYGIISSKEVRSSGDYISLNIDESNFTKGAQRIVSKETTIGRTVILTDWGFLEGNRVFSLSNVLLSADDYEKLVGMEEDNSNTFYFSYLNDIWRVIIQNVSGKWEGGHYVTRLTISVIEKVEDSYE